MPDALEEDKIVVPDPVPFIANLLLSNVFNPVIDSEASSVESVPLFGKVRLVVPEIVRDNASAPIVVKDPPRVIVLLPLFTPVPP